MGGAEYIPGLTALAGIVVGALASYCANYRIERRREKREARAVTDAIVSEIDTLVEVFGSRGYVSFIDDIINRLSNSPAGTIEFMSVVTKEDYSPIYTAHIVKIGTIPDSVRMDIVRFHQLVVSVICDIREGFGVCATKGGCLSDFESLKLILDEAITTGEEIKQVWYNEKPLF